MSAGAPALATVVVNLFGGPGAGKTLAAFRIMSLLTDRGHVCEYVGEYAKELVWDVGSEVMPERTRERAARLLDGSLASQRAIHEVQCRRVERLVGQCDFVVTDSPTLLPAIYLAESGPGAETFAHAVAERFLARDNFNVLVRRTGAYDEAGHIETLDEAREVDARVERALRELGAYFGSYTKDQVGRATRNMEVTLAKARRRPRAPAASVGSSGDVGPGERSSLDAPVPRTQAHAAVGSQMPASIDAAELARRAAMAANVSRARAAVASVRARQATTPGLERILRMRDEPMRGQGRT